MPDNNAFESLTMRHIESVRDHISVCICTYRRNQMLERLLRKLALQETGGLFDVSIVIVDNDANGHAKETVNRLREELNLNINYGIEPENTIPAARNHAIRLASGNFVGIIDDDEFPPHHWLLNLYKAIRTFEVDGALGPVFPYFEQDPPDWLVKGRFCERPIHRTGTLLSWDQTRTGNVLLKKEVFDKHGICFDLRWKTSGSDRAFFKEAMRAGCKFVACEEAPVYELVPPERWTKRYYLKRAIIHGFNAHRNNLGHSNGLLGMLIPFKLAGALLAYTLAMPFLALMGSHIMMKYAEKGAHHLSHLAAMLGIELIKKRDF